MMTSDAAVKTSATYQKAYVWVWLPSANVPVVAGVLSRQGRQWVFN